MMKTCPVCKAVVDLAVLTSHESEHGPRAGLVGYSQADTLCPNCGALVERRIDGTLVQANGPDPRAEIAAVVLPDAEPDA